MGSQPQSSNFYERLGVGQDATADEIRKAYKKLALQWHPDKNPSRREEASRNFQKLAEAYDCLSDPPKRRQYDQYGWLRDDAETNYSQRAHYGNNSYSCGRSRMSQPTFVFAYDEDPFLFSHPPFLDHDFDFTFDRAQKIFESVFGRESKASMGLFGLMDSVFEPAPFRVPRQMRSVRKLGRDPFDMDSFDSDFSLTDFPRGTHVQSTSTHRTFSSNGQVSTTKTVHCVNGKRTTRVEKTIKGSDGRIHKSVTEHQDDLNREDSHSFGLPLTSHQRSSRNNVDCITDGVNAIPSTSTHHYHRELSRNPDANDLERTRTLGYRSRR